MRQLYIAVGLFLVFLIGCYYLVTQRLDLSRFYPPSYIPEPAQGQYRGLKPPRPIPSMHVKYPPLPQMSPPPRIRATSNVHGSVPRPQPKVVLPPIAPVFTPIPAPVPSYAPVTPPPAVHTVPPIAVPTYVPIPLSNPSPTASP